MIPFLARRYLSARDKPFFTPFFLFICLFGVAAGLFALIFVLSVMEGFEHDFERRVIGFKAPLVVTGDDWRTLQDLKDQIPVWDARIQEIQPFVEGEAILESEMEDSVGVRIRGVEKLGERFGEIFESDLFSPTSAVLGAELATTIRVHPDWFEKVRLIFPFGDVGPTGEMLPRERKFTVTGSFRSGFYDFDSKYVLVQASEAADLFGEFGRYGLELWLASWEEVDSVAEGLRSRLPEGLKVTTWREQNPKLFAAMKLERIGMLVLLSIFLGIASFNIYGLTSLTVLEKLKDMAVLRSLGLRVGQVVWIFLLKAGILGLAGSLIGGALGVGAVLYFQGHPIRLPETYYVEFLPLALDWGQAVVFVVGAPIVAMAAALYPAISACRVSPVEVLRYE